MHASDFDVDFGSGLYNCCWDHIQSHKGTVKEGTVITCDDCGEQMVLVKFKSSFIWRRYEE